MKEGRIGETELGKHMNNGFEQEYLKAGVFNLGYAYPWGYVGSFQGVGEHHCRVCIILLEKVGVDCMWSAEPIGDVHFTAS